MDTLQRLLGSNGIRYSPLGGEGKVDPLSRFPKKPVVKLVVSSMMGLVVLMLMYMYMYSETTYANTDASANVVQPSVQVTAAPEPSVAPDYNPGAYVAVEEDADGQNEDLVNGEMPVVEEATETELAELTEEEAKEAAEEAGEHQDEEEKEEEEQSEEEIFSDPEASPVAEPPAPIEIVDNPPNINTSANAPAYDFSPGNRKLTVVVFASDPGPALCKVMMSAIIMGYPMPHIINWGQHLEDAFPGYIRAQGNIGNHQLKILGSLSYLEELSHPTTKEADRLDDDDLVLMVDAYDVWFQTPPEVLISRYHETNREANERLQKQWTGKGKAPMNQTIVFSSQKKCFPTRKSAYQMQCSALPDSPLRKDLYGNKTDANPAHYRHVRPKFINSGAIMGPVGDLKRYIRKVQERLGTKALNEKGNMPSDQGMFGEIWGEQEVYRTWLRNQTSKRQFRPKDLFMTQRDYEFGVGMDYKQDICIATVFEEDDGQIFKLNNKTKIAKESKKLGIKPRLKGVPADLDKSRNPMDILDIPEDEKLDWGEMPMYADFFTESVPVMVHHNAHHWGLKVRNQEWWDKMWYFPYFRDLITTRLAQFDQSPLGSVKSSQKPLKGKKGEKKVDMITYYPLTSDKDKRLPRIYRPGQAMERGLDVGEWEDICYNRKEPEKHWSEEVFRDGKGGLKGEVAQPVESDDENVSG